VLLAACLVVTACAPVHGADTFRFLGRVEFPTGFSFAGTEVGGLSAISYDPGRQVYYVISDDRSVHNPARFYSVRISLAENKLGGVEFVDTHPWLDPHGQPYITGSIDPEGIAFDARRQQLYWSSEGERRPEKSVLIDPSVRVSGLDGGYRGEFTLPPMLAMSIQETGPRRNEALEGLTVTPSGRFVWAAMEDPGYNDGQPPTTGSGALTRITKFDIATAKAAAQYAYPLDPITAPAGTANGLSDLVALDDDSFLVVERSHGGRNVARIYRARVADAADILDRPSIADTPPTPMKKVLVADLATMAQVQPLDNVEGITLGPRLADGRQSVVLITDNNFSAMQVTQFFAFAL
jgi:hypothetical protein